MSNSASKLDHIGPKWDQSDPIWMANLPSITETRLLRLRSAQMSSKCDQYIGNEVEKRAVYTPFTVVNSVLIIYFFVRTQVTFEDRHRTKRRHHNFN